MQKDLFNPKLGRVGKFLVDVADDNPFKTGGVGGTVGKALGGIGKVLGPLGFAINIGNLGIELKKYATGETAHAGDVVQAEADLIAGVIGATGLPGAAFSVGYTGGSIAAGQIDKHTGWYDRAVIQGHQVKDALRGMGVGEEWAHATGAVAAGIQGANPIRLISDPLTDWLLP